MAEMTYTSFASIGGRLWQTDIMMSRFWFGQEVLMSRANNVAIGIRKHPFVWQKSLFVLGTFGAFAWVSMLQAP